MDGHRILRIGSSSSTNDYLSHLPGIEDLPDGYTVWATEQTQGRGQGGTHWESAPGMNLTFSTLFHPTFMLARDQFFLCEAIALGILDFVSGYLDGATVKWPNDIYVGSGKLSGTLTECVLDGRFIKTAVVGIGLNVNQTRFTSDAPNPVSMSSLTGESYSMDHLLEELLETICKKYAVLRSETSYQRLHQEYLLNLYLKDTPALYRDSSGIFRGTIRDVTRSGRLLIEREDETIVEYGLKEVSPINC